MKPTNNKNNTFEREDLPATFQPRGMDVIIGRGKKVNKHNDKNFVLQDLLSTFAGDYLYGKKERKSELLTIVVQEIRATGCAFIKKESASAPHNAGRWYSVDETAARNSAAQFLRNHLSENYKSSKQFKKKLRQDKKKDTSCGSATCTSTTEAPPSNSSANVSMSSSSSQSSLASHDDDSAESLSWRSSHSHSHSSPDYDDSCWNTHKVSREETENALVKLSSQGTFHSKLWTSLDQATPAPAPFPPLPQPLSSSLALATFDPFEPRPLADEQQPSSLWFPDVFGDEGLSSSSVFQSMEDEELFLSWSNANATNQSQQAVL